MSAARLPRGPADLDHRRLPSPTVLAASTTSLWGTTCAASVRFTSRRRRHGDRTRPGRRRLAGAARARRRGGPRAELVDELRRVLPPGTARVHDLGCGTGSMVRGSPRGCRGRSPGCSTTGTPSCSTRVVVPSAARADAGLRRDPARRRHPARPGRRGDADLLTASALLDMMPGPSWTASSSAAPGWPAPSWSRSRRRAGRARARRAAGPRGGAAFDAHQRRTVGGRRLLGPDGVGAAAPPLLPAGPRGHRAPQPVAARPRPARPDHGVVHRLGGGGRRAATGAAGRPRP